MSSSVSSTSLNSSSFTIFVKASFTFSPKGLSFSGRSLHWRSPTLGSNASATGKLGTCVVYLPSLPLRSTQFSTMVGDCHHSSFRQWYGTTTCWPEEKWLHGSSRAQPRRPDVTVVHRVWSSSSTEITASYIFKSYDCRSGDQCRTPVSCEKVYIPWELNDKYSG